MLHTLFEKWVSREIIFARISNSTIQPLDATHIIWKMSFARNYFCEDWQFNHSTTRCNRYVKDIASHVKRHYRVASQPFQQLLQHIQLENWSLRESRFGDSTNSTTVYNTHFLKIKFFKAFLVRMDHSTISTTVATHT